MILLLLVPLHPRFALPLCTLHATFPLSHPHRIPVDASGSVVPPPYPGHAPASSELLAALPHHRAQPDPPTTAGAGFVAGADSGVSTRAAAGGAPSRRRSSCGRRQDPRLGRKREQGQRQPDALAGWEPLVRARAKAREANKIVSTVCVCVEYTTSLPACYPSCCGLTCASTNWQWRTKT